MSTLGRTQESTEEVLGPEWGRGMHSHASFLERGDSWGFGGGTIKAERQGKLEEQQHGDISQGQSSSGGGVTDETSMVRMPARS